MIANIKRYLRRRRVAQLNDELTWLRVARMELTQREFALRGKLAVLEASA